MQTKIQFLRLPDVIKMVGLKKSTIYSMMLAGTFPRARHISRRAVGWLEHEIQEFIRGTC